MTDRHKVFNELMKSALTTENLKQALRELEGIPFYRKYGVRISNAITALDAAIKAAEKSAVSSIGSEQPVSTGQVKGSNPLRQATPPAAIAARNTATHEHLSTMIGLVLGARDRRNLLDYKDGSIIDRDVCAAVEHLKDWPYPPPAAPAQPEQEPVAEVKLKTTGGNVGIATVIHEIYSHYREPLRVGDKLYTTPPAAQPCPYIRSTAEGTHHCALSQRQPLTDEELRVIENKINPNMRWRSSDEEGITLYPNEYYDLVKAIEAAHGITGEKT